jgi:hypothetical protein
MIAFAHVCCTQSIRDASSVESSFPVLVADGKRRLAIN